MKLKFTALSISSIDMNTVMIFRRNKKPATPRVNRTALRIRYQERGTPVIDTTPRTRNHPRSEIRNPTSLFSLQFLSRQNDRSNNSDQNQDGRYLERQQIPREQRLADILGR